MRQYTIQIRHTCNHVYTYPMPDNDPQGDIATGLALIPCAECRVDEDWMDVHTRAEIARRRHERTILQV